MKSHNLMLKAKRSLIKHGPEICTVAGVLSMLVGTVLAVKATEPALEHIDEAEIPEDAGKKEKAVAIVKATWKDYTPAAICEIGGIGLIFSANRTYSARNANLANMLYVSETAYRNLQNKLEEKLPMKQVDDIRDSLAEDRVKANPISDDIYNEHINSYDGKQWFHDSMTGQYFRSTDAAVDRIFIDLNNKILDELYVQHGELLMTLGEASGKMFETNGWEIGEKVDVRKTYMTCNGEVMVDIEYTRPHPI